MCNTKVCKICNEQKQLEEFYRSSQMADGLENRCKACHLVQQRASTQRKLEGIANPKRIYTKMSDEEASISKENLLKYQREYQLAWQHKKMEVKKLEKLQRIIEQYGSLEAYEALEAEKRHVASVQASRDWRLKKKLERLALEETAKVITIDDCLTETT